MKTDITLVSVITVVRNAASNIEATLRSVIALKDERLQYVVLDGGSTDGTLQILERYTEHIDYMHSRADGGIYEAMNDALAYTTGSYILNINAGDRLLHLPYAALTAYVADEACGAVCGSVVTEAGRVITPIHCRTKLRYYNILPHQGLCYKRELLASSPYDTHYRVFADFDLNQRLFLLGRKRYHVENVVVAEHAMDGVSNHKSAANELFAIIRKNCGLIAQCIAWCRFKYLGVLSRINAWSV
ncbi:MAG: glycosyltransferase [Bacteroidales bacterium]|nr:glycosyltransferase [Bacteroidales bacterium]